MPDFEYWAVKNDCNGVFPHTLSGSRADAEAKLAEAPFGEGDYVVPVIMFEVKGRAGPSLRKKMIDVLRHGVPRGVCWGWLE